MAINNIIIHGRLTADPELKQTPSGVSVCTISVAVDRSYTKGEEKTTDFFSVVCWRGLAEVVAKYFNKGKEIIVNGEMQSRKWQDKDGNSRTAWEIQAQTVDFCGSKIAEKAEEVKTETVTVPAGFVPVDGDSDLPF